LRPSPLLAALALAAVLAAGCGGDGGSSSAEAVKPLGKESAGSVVQFADCTDWRGGSREARMATVVALRGQLTPQRSASAASPLPDERAYQLLDKACSPQFAQSLRLYKLYVKMQGFAPLSQ
jgi:hypothetical protein